MKNPPTLILVADSSHARLISHKPDGNAVLWKMNSRLAMKRSIASTTDKPGRSFNSTGSLRHSMEPRTTAQRAAQITFSRKVVKALEKSLMAKNFGKFIVVAAPRTLGDLRRQISKETKALTTAELRKDLAALPDHEVVSHLRDALIAV